MILELLTGIKPGASSNMFPSAVGDKGALSTASYTHDEKKLVIRVMLRDNCEHRQTMGLISQ